jgi:uncharacterized membrane protein
MPSPAVLIHIVFALGAVALGPAALWLRKGSRWHRAAGYAWVTMMSGAALSSLFIRSFGRPNVLGYTAIHLLTLLTIAGLAGGIWYISQKQVRSHQRTMLFIYIGAVTAGLLALLPQRFLGNWLWQQTLGWV